MATVSERDVAITKALSSLDNLISRKTGLPQLRLCFELIGHGGVKIEKATQLLEFHNILLSSTAHKGRATAMIQYMLSVIIKVQESEKLLRCDKEELENCTPILAFSSVIVYVCNELGETDFKKLKVAICLDHLRCLPDNVPSPEELLSRLFHKTAITASDVSLLAYWLDHTSVGRSDLAKEIMVYARKYAFPLFLEESLLGKLSSDKLNNLAKLCSNHLECDFQDVSSPKLLVSKVHEAKIISLDDPKLLTTQWLIHESVNCCDLAQAITKHSNNYVSQPPDPAPKLQLGTYPVQETSSGDSQLSSGVEPGGRHSELAVGPIRSQLQGVPSSSDVAGTDVNFKDNVGSHGDEEKDASHPQQPSNTSGFDSATSQTSTKSTTDNTTITTVTGNRKPGTHAVSSPPSSPLTYPVPSITRDTSFSKLPAARQDSDSSNSHETDTLLKDNESEALEVSLMILSPETQQREKEKSRKRFVRLCVCCTVFVSIGLLILLIGTIGFGIYGGCYSPANTQVLARGGDSVVVATISDSLWLIWNVVYECPQDGDESHTSELYLIQEDQLHHRTRSRVRTSSEIFNQTEPSCKTGFLGTEHLLYLLSGSVINYSICLSSDEETDELGKLFIFDNDISYEDYVFQEYPCPDEEAIFSHDLIIGKPGNFECTNISFPAAANSYHYVVSRTPANIRFSYTYDVSVRYLDPTDFSGRFCTFFSEDHDKCVLQIPKLFTRTVVVDHVLQNEGSNPVTTHICFESRWKRGLIGIVSSFAALFVLVFFILFVCTVVACWCKKNKSRCIKCTGCCSSSD